MIGSSVASRIARQAFAVTFAATLITAVGLQAPAEAMPPAAIDVYYFSDANHTALVGTKEVRCTTPYSVTWGTVTQFAVSNYLEPCY